MKKTLSWILGTLCVVSILLSIAQTNDGGPAVLWSLCCIAVSALCGWGFAKLNPEIFKDSTL